LQEEGLTVPNKTDQQKKLPSQRSREGEGGQIAKALKLSKSKKPIGLSEGRQSQDCKKKSKAAKSAKAATDTSKRAKAAKSATRPQSGRNRPR
jgi:hypothetical protein